MNTVTEIVEVTLTAGQFANNEIIPLPTGQCKRVGLAIIKGTPNKNFNVTLLGNDGNDVVKAHSYKFWEQRQGGDYFDSLKPVNFKCGRNIKAQLVCPEVLSEDITVQFMFLIAQD